MYVATAAPFDIVTLFDCDNTLLDHDHVVADLRHHLEQEFGPRNRDRYFEIFEALREELGYADYLGALQRYRLGANNDPRLLKMSCFLVDYPFADRVYPGSLEVIEHLRAIDNQVPNIGKLLHRLELDWLFQVINER